MKPATYYLAELEQLQTDMRLSSNPVVIAQLDQLATASYLLYASHLYNGRINPSQLDSNRHIQPKQLPLAQYLQKALQEGSIKQSLANLANNYSTYTSLKHELENLQFIAQRGGWPILALDHYSTEK